MKRIYPEFVEPSYKENLLLKFQYLVYSKIFKPSLFWFIQNTYRFLSRKGVVIGSCSNEELECMMPEAYKKRMAQWQKDLLEKKLEEIKKIIDHRIYITSLYENLLKQKDVKTVTLSEDYEPVFLRYPLLVKNKVKVLNEAKKRRIEIGDWFLSPVHPNLDGWEKIGYEKGTCHIAEEICEHIINLPTHPGINEEEAKKVVEFIINSKKLSLEHIIPGI